MSDLSARWRSVIARQPSLLDDLRSHVVHRPADRSGKPEATGSDAETAHANETDPYAEFLDDEADPYADLLNGEADPYADLLHEEDDPYAAIFSESNTSEENPAQTLERIVPASGQTLTEWAPPRRVDVWLSREPEALLDAVRLLLGRDIAAAPDFTPLGICHGERFQVFRWDWAGGQLAASALEIEQPLHEALLASRSRERPHMVVVCSPRAPIPADRMVLVMPPCQLSLEPYRRWWPEGFETRRCVWFEREVGRIAGEDVQRFLRTALAPHAVHAAMLNLREAQRHASSFDSGSAMASAVEQFGQLSQKEAAQWLHLSP